MKPNRPTGHRSFPAVGLGVVTVAVLYLAKPVIVPLAPALLPTFVPSPIAAALQRVGLKGGARRESEKRLGGNVCGCARRRSEAEPPAENR